MTYYDPNVRDASLSRRPQNRRDAAWIRALLERVPVCRVATRWEDWPFVHPTSFVYRAATHDVIYHSNIAGRLRANTDRHERVCLEASEVGALLPSNDPLELSMQYRSVMVFGTARVLDDADEARAALDALTAKYFPDLRPGQELMPISEAALARTTVYALSVERWSGKENWSAQAVQTSDWPALPPSPTPHDDGFRLKGTPGAPRETKEETA
ncbi:pyridoxamine 5'-phosphate oxidase family protein [Deinococcus maricopensis]|uniref:Negative transcriptional regulator n=1 Tax=Deinococcus maricopensis (strain DSM 21211 / LMG 22137 / NRRL B-23946 / LB-34) TaxID=709986 RepID=E8UAJ9_DEIML|nr:pyridoxamine 5'-phosphate oxidase family protein [Deinococcus maricopensis]ADV68088.1 Negative transcriptional regulator [Deinococcus maricopensis DSM 21211]